MTNKKKILTISALVLYYVILGVIWFGPLQNLFVINQPDNGYYFSRQFDSQQKWVNTDNLNRINATFSGDQDGLTYGFPVKPAERVIVRILYGIPFHSREADYSFNRVTLLADDLSEMLTRRIGYLTYKPGSIESGNFKLVLSREAENSDYIVRRLEITVLPPRKDFLPNLPLFGALLFLPLLLRRRKLIYVLVFLLIFLGAHLRWQEIERVSSALAHPDNYHETSYRLKADKMLLFTDDGFYASPKIAYDGHEPFYTLVAKAFLYLFGSSDLHMRFISFFFGIGVLGLVFLVGLNLFDRSAWALLPVAFLAVNSFLIEQGSFGLRTEFESCLFLAIFYFGWQKRRFIPAAVLSAVWMLTRVFSLPTSLLMIGRGLLKTRHRLIKKAIIFLLIMVLVIIPYLPYKLDIYKTHGDFFWDSNQYALSHQHYEFGTEPKITDKGVRMFDYLFKRHSLTEVALYTAVGTVGVAYSLNAELFDRIQAMNHVLKMIFKGSRGASGMFSFVLFNLVCLISVIYSLFSKKLRWILLILLAATFHNFFLYGAAIIKRTGILEMHRTIAHALPFYAFLVFGTAEELINVWRFRVYRKRK